jgi:hypothetical protein
VSRVDYRLLSIKSTTCSFSNPKLHKVHQKRVKKNERARKIRESNRESVDVCAARNNDFDFLAYLSNPSSSRSWFMPKGMHARCLCQVILVHYRFLSLESTTCWFSNVASRSTSEKCILKYEEREKYEKTIVNRFGVCATSHLTQT